MEKVEVRRYSSNVTMICAIINALLIFLIFHSKVLLLWILPALFCLLIVYFSKRKKGNILLNNEGLFEDGELIILWENVKTIEEVTNFFNFNPHIN